MSWRPSHLQLLSHDDGSGCRWDLARIGLTLHTTQAASQDPDYGWNCRPWTSKGGIFWDESCRDWDWQFNVIRTKPHRQTLLLTSLLWVWKLAVRLLGWWVFTYWTGQTWAHKSICSTLRFDSWPWFWLLWFRTLSLLYSLCPYRSLTKGLRSLLEGVKIEMTLTAGPHYFTLSTHGQKSCIKLLSLHIPQAGRPETTVCLLHASVFQIIQVPSG